VASPLEGKTHLYRVRLGPVASVADFDAIAAHLSALGIADARLAID
jgi:cell division protein FtsN